MTSLMTHWTGPVFAFIAMLYICQICWFCLLVYRGLRERAGVPPLPDMTDRERHAYAALAPKEKTR